MNLLAAKGITSIDHLKQIVHAKIAANPGVVVAKHTATNPGVVVAKHTASNPGVVIADHSDLWTQQPRVHFFNNIMDEGHAKYYNAILQNPGVQLYLNQHPDTMTRAMAAEKVNTPDEYRKVLENPGFKYYIQQHADQLGSLSMGMPYMIWFTILIINTSNH